MFTVVVILVLCEMKYIPQMHTNIFKFDLKIIPKQYFIINNGLHNYSFHDILFEINALVGNGITKYKISIIFADSTKYLWPTKSFERTERLCICTEAIPSIFDDSIKMYHRKSNKISSKYSVKILK